MSTVTPITNNSALPLAGRLAIVTGASRGIGAEIAWELAVRGANVCLCHVAATSTQRVQDLATKIRNLPHAPAAYICQGDLGSTDGPEQLVAHLREQVAEKQQDLVVHILVNCAAVLTSKPMGQITAGDVDALLGANVRGLILLTQAVLPYLPNSASAVGGGRIINISSTAGRAPFPDMTLYTASKGAMEAMTRSWAEDLGPRGVTVNVVAPGPVESEMLDLVPAPLVEAQRQRTPLGHRLGNVRDIAPVVAFLASDDGRWVTGQTICASGGYLMI